MAECSRAASGDGSPVRVPNFTSMRALIDCVDISTIQYVSTASETSVRHCSIENDTPERLSIKVFRISSALSYDAVLRPTRSLQMYRLRLRTSLLVAALLALVAIPAAAQSGQTISLTVDATQAPLKIVRTHMTLAVKTGPLTLYYPKWIPGEYGPDGPIGNVTGLKFAANGKTIPWTRDTLDVFTFHVNIPTAVDQLE